MAVWDAFLDWTHPAFWASVYYLGEWVVRIVMLAVVPMRRNPEAAKGWLLLIFFLPIIGLPLYLLIGRPRLPRWRTELLGKLPEALAAVRQRLRKEQHLLNPDVSADFAPVVRLAQNLGHLPLLAGNAADILVDYDGTIDRLVTDIDAATDHVHLLYYIYADDATSQKVTDALGRAVRRNVTCRVMIDRIGSGKHRKRIVPKLTALGVHVQVVLPVGFFRRKAGRYDLRNHRKIAVIDGRIGYTGSQNLITSGFKHGLTFEELVVRVTGPAVLELQYVFIADWFLETEEVLANETTFPTPQATGTIPVQALPSGPEYPMQNNKRFITALVHGARQRMVLTTPYFIPDDALLQAMETAAVSGVEVHLVVSAMRDQLLVGLAQQSYYEELLEAGVKIHLYDKNFLHAKHVSIDNALTLIGSSNLDIRSFVLNAEITLLFYDTGLTSRLNAEQERYFASCRTLTLAEWRLRPRWLKVIQNLARLLSPLL
jgi:cardiolipin synthase A/B